LIAVDVAHRVNCPRDVDHVEIVEPSHHRARVRLPLPLYFLRFAVVLDTVQTVVDDPRLTAVSGLRTAPLPTLDKQAIRPKAGMGAAAYLGIRGRGNAV
jgi:hypothetical protein